MLSWKDEEEAMQRKGSGSGKGFARPVIEPQRTGSLRKSSEYSPAASPRGASTPKANSLLRGPGHTTEGALGAEGWWRHMDHAAANEEAGSDKSSEKKSSGFVPQSLITGQKQNIWGDEPAAESSKPAEAAPAPAPPAEEVPAAAAAAAVPAAAAVGSPAGPAPGQQAEGKGWWNKMDNSVLNAPPEKDEAGTIKKGERVMGGGFVPQFGVAGGNAYKSIFDDEPKTAGADAGVAAAQEQVASWAPFAGGACAPAAAAGAAAAVTEDDWSNFSSAVPAPPPPPKVA